MTIADVIFVCYGDVLRLFQAKQIQADLRIAYSPMDALKIAEGFEATAIGAKPAQAQGLYKKNPAMVRVVGEAAAHGEHCLQLTDGPG